MRKKLFRSSFTGVFVAVIATNLCGLLMGIIFGGWIIVTAVFTLGSFLILVLCYRAARRQARTITGPLGELTAAANAMAAGDYQKKVVVDSDDEVGTLAAHFESMRQQVREYTESLEKKVAERTEQLQDAMDKINEELLAAQRIQQALFPADLGDSENINVSAVCLPVGQVSGDFYDVVRLSPDRTLFAILDVTGHGVPAALGTAMIKNSIVRNTRGHAVSPKDLIQRMNSEIINYVPKTQLISAFVCVVDTGNMTFSYASAGHPPALLVRPAGSGEVRELKGKGMLMCIVPDLVVQEESVAIRPGDKIFLCTDGLFDLFVKLNARAGLEKMGRFLLEMRDMSVDMDVQKLLTLHNGLAKKGEVADDATVVGIQIKGPRQSAKPG